MTEVLLVNQCVDAAQCTYTHEKVFVFRNISEIIFVGDISLLNPSSSYVCVVVLPQSTSKLSA